MEAFQEATGNLLGLWKNVKDSKIHIFANQENYISKLEYLKRYMSHPFIDQMECLPLCAPRDQSHISSQIITEVSWQMLLHHDI
jgi:hypothetical protein